MGISEEIWTVGKANVNGMPVIYKFLNRLPNKKAIENMPWLTVISWKYDGSMNNGMPDKDTNAQMILLEDALDEIKGKEKVYLMAYTATGNNLKEFVYYISDSDIFMKNLNNSLSEKPEYPLEINFYKDEDWSDLVKLSRFATKILCYQINFICSILLTYGIC